MAHTYFNIVLYTFCLIGSRALMMRNDALISKMVSNFQKDNTGTIETTPRPDKKPKNVLSIMQGVLCRNFPTIPCDMIVEDETLKTLIERSIQQLKYKKLSMERTTLPPRYHLTLFPTINSEDLSNFLQVSETGYYSKDNKVKSRSVKHRKRLARNNGDERETKKKSSKKREGRIYNSSKKIRKFYPHKIKYKDKLNKPPRDNFKDYSDEKLSMSVESPEPTMGNRKRMSPNYNMDPGDPPAWRIDYMKHGEPSINMFGYEPDTLKEKLVKTVPNVISVDNMMEQMPRKDVLHPDVYIKKNFIRKNALDLNSDGID